MIDFDKMRLKMSLLVAEGNFKEEQARELHGIVNKIETPGSLKISPFKAIKMINDAQKNADLFETKYLEYGGSENKITELGNEVLKNTLETLPGLSSLGKIKRTITGGK